MYLEKLAGLAQGANPDRQDFPAADHRLHALLSPRKAVDNLLVLYTCVLA
jgi:hypothetical protein